MQHASLQISTITCQNRANLSCADTLVLYMLCVTHRLTRITRVTVVWEWQELLPTCLRLSWHTKAERRYFPSILMRGILRLTPGIRGLRCRAVKIMRFRDSVVTEGARHTVHIHVSE